MAYRIAPGPRASGRRDRAAWIDAQREDDEIMARGTEQVTEHAVAAAKPNALGTLMAQSPRVDRSWTR